MASPEAGLNDYERLREENIRRNSVILASLRRKADELTSAIQFSSPAKRGRGHPRKKPATPTSPAVLRRSLRLSRLPPTDSPDAEPTPEPPPPPRSTSVSSSLASSILAAASPLPPVDKVHADDFDAGRELVLRPADVRRVVPDRILAVRVLPLVDRTVVAAGNKLGNIGIWDVDGMVEVEEGGDGANGVFEYLPHRGHVSAIVAHPAAPQKIYSCSYTGEICLMDLEKETFNMIQLCDYPIYSLCQPPNSAKCLYFGDRQGEVKLFDERMGKVSTAWESHDKTINSIDFHPENKHMLATSSTDRTACIWDLRRLKNKKEESLKVFKLNRSVQSAYFSPSGRMIATTRFYSFYICNDVPRSAFEKEKSAHKCLPTAVEVLSNCLFGREIECHDSLCANYSDYRLTNGLVLVISSLDDTVQVFGGDDFAKSHIIKHDNQTGRWLSTFKAIWGWNDTNLFIGNMKRAIDIISVNFNGSSLSASNNAYLESEHMTAIPCRFSAHPFKVGHLACASSGGKVFLWTRA